MSSFPGMRKLRITANDTKSLATKYSQAHFIYGNTEWFTAYPVINIFREGIKGTKQNTKIKGAVATAPFYFSVILLRNFL